MLEVHCSRCTRRLTEPGGLLFGPPQGDRCEKRHLCATCYAATVEMVDNEADLTKALNNLSARIQHERDVGRELRRQIAALTKEEP